ncbi:MULTISPECIES: hypothetical protein [Streptomyces]|uniref:hypothetical protein n=1 Tax=Streptomyces TaxID=1883 RepID=UPI0004CCDBA0|nr:MULTISPECIES: hypothetical protein [Streptomyces]KOT51143.1 hypothetical protein ADK43_32630 [Streptomyces rimosus subsp. rimosus]
MTYELADPIRRVSELNEYLNTETGKYEIIRRHGPYSVKETFLTPEGRILFIAHNAYASEPFAVGVYNSDQATYCANRNDARRHFAWRIAESFGLTVDREGSKAIPPASREHATALVKKIKESADEWDRVVQDGDEMEQMGVGSELWTNALSLAKHLQRTGVLSTPVFESWEVVG